MPFAVRRARERAGHLAATAVVIAMAIATVGGLGAAADHVLDAGVAEIVASADPAAQGIVIDAPLAADPAEQDALITGQVHAAFGGADVELGRRVWGRADADRGGVQLLADPAIAEHARLVEGAWPTGPDEVAVAQPAAGLLGTSVGDALTLDGTATVVTGIWAVTDPADPAWAGMPSPVSGRSGDAIGPVLADESLLAALGATPRARWTVLPAGAVTVRSADAYREGLRRLDAAMPVLDPGGAQGLRIEGRLDATLARATAAVASARAMLAVPLIMLIAIGVVVVGVLTRTLAGSRSADLRLRRARGASTSTLVFGAMGEAAVAAALAALVGAGAAIAIGADAATILLVAAAATVVAVALTAAATLGVLRAPATARSDGGRASAAALLGPFVFAAAVAALAVAQLLDRGLVAGGGLDPLAASAPALLLIALGLLATLLAGPAAALGELLARRRPGLTGVLALRRLSRQAGRVAAGVLSLVLAAASAVFAGSLAISLLNASDAGVALVVGADLRGVYDTQGMIDQRHAGVDATAGGEGAAVDDAFPVVGTTATIGPVRLALVAAPTEAIAALPASSGIALDGLPVGTPTGLRGGQLDITVKTWPTPDASLGIVAWIADADGAASRRELGTVAADGEPHVVSSPVTDADSLLAIELVPHGVGAAAMAVDVTATDGGGPIALPVERTTLAPQQRIARITTTSDLPERLPVAITASLAERLAATEGSDLSLRVGSVTAPVEVTVTHVAPALPGIGAQPGVVVDLGAFVARTVELGGAVPATNELWVSTSDLASASTALRSTAAEPIRLVTPATIGVSPVTGPALALVTLGIAVIALIAAAGFAVVSAGAVRSRRAEVVPLQSFGYTSRLQRATSATETALAAAFAIALGALAGGTAAFVLAPALIATITGVTA